MLRNFALLFRFIAIFRTLATCTACGCVFTSVAPAQRRVISRGHIPVGERTGSTGTLLNQLTFVAFPGSGQTTIAAMAADPSGNVLVAGTTNSPDFPVVNAAQPNLGLASILRTTNLGGTWTPVGSPPGIANAVAPDLGNPNILHAASTAGIFKSTDSGHSWRQTYASPATDITVDPGNTQHVAALNSTSPSLALMFRSIDGGETWTNADCSTCTGPELVADPNGTGALLSVGGALTLSRDWGQTFQTLTPPGSFVLAAAFVPSRPGWIWASSQGLSPRSTQLSLSTDFGATWAPIPPPVSPNVAIYAIATDPSQSSTVIAGTNAGLFKSVDQGETWTQLGANQDLPWVPIISVSHACSGNGGFFFLDAGQNFAVTNVAFNSGGSATFQTPQLSQVATIAAGPGCSVYAVRHDQGNTNAFVAKLSPDGKIAYTTYLGGDVGESVGGLAVDAQGNAYVFGETTSADFPATLPHLGPTGSESVFVTKFAPSGSVAWSLMIGGAKNSGGGSSSSATAVAADASGNIYVLGSTHASDFPVTPGVVETVLGTAGSGFLLKLSANASLLWSTFLDYTPTAILVGPDAQPVIGVTESPLNGYSNSSPYLAVQLNARAAEFVRYSPVLPGAPPLGRSALLRDSAGNLIVVADAGIFKLSALDWSILYSFTLPANVTTGAAYLDSTGSPVIAVNSGAGLSLRSPLLGGPEGGAAILKQIPNVYQTEFASYLPGSGTPYEGAPALALAPDDSIYVGLTNPTRILHFAPPSPGFSVDGVANAFDGDPSVVVGGGLYSIAVSGMASPPPTVNLGVQQSLPTTLGGVQVTFDGVPAPIVSVNPGQVVVAAPWNLPANQEGRFHFPPFTQIQVTYNGAKSSTVWMPVSPQALGLAGTVVPLTPSILQLPGGNVLNQDGTANSLSNPAAAGSPVTFFATGMGVSHPPRPPGSVAMSESVLDVPALWASWSQPPSTPGASPPPETFFTAPGYVSAIATVKVPVPSDVQNLGGTYLASGVYYVPFFIWRYPPGGEGIYPSPPSPVGVYVH